MSNETEEEKEENRRHAKPAAIEMAQPHLSTIRLMVSDGTRKVKPWRSLCQGPIEVSLLGSSKEMSPGSQEKKGKSSSSWLWEWGNRFSDFQETVGRVGNLSSRLAACSVFALVFHVFHPARHFHSLTNSQPVLSITTAAGR